MPHLTEPDYEPLVALSPDERAPLSPLGAHAAQVRATEHWRVPNMACPFFALALPGPQVGHSPEAT